MKKYLKIFAVLVLVIPAAAILTACGKKPVDPVNKPLDGSYEFQSFTIQGTMFNKADFKYVDDTYTEFKTEQIKINKVNAVVTELKKPANADLYLEVYQEATGNLSATAIDIVEAIVKIGVEDAVLALADAFFFFDGIKDIAVIEKSEDEYYLFGKDSGAKLTIDGNNITAPLDEGLQVIAGVPEVHAVWNPQEGTFTLDFRAVPVPQHLDEINLMMTMVMIRTGNFVA